MTVPIMKHEKLVKLKDELKAKDFKEFLEFKATRYALFRVQTFLSGGAMPEPEHNEIAKKYEKEIEQLGGVKAFAIEWDLNPKNGKVIRRDKSVWKAHEDFMKKAAVNLATITDGDCLK